MNNTEFLNNVTISIWVPKKSSSVVLLSNTTHYAWIDLPVMLEAKCIEDLALVPAYKYKKEASKSNEEFLQWIKERYPRDNVYKVGTTNSFEDLKEKVVTHIALRSIKE